MASIRVDNESMRFDSVTPDKCPVRRTVVRRPRVTSRLRRASVTFLGHPSGARKSKPKRYASGCKPIPGMGCSDNQNVRPPNPVGVAIGVT